MSKAIVKLCACNFVAIGMGLGGWSCAMNAAAADAQAATTQLDEVVVTAQKKEENLQKASVAVETLNAGDLARQGITNAIDLQEVLPVVRFVAADQMTVLIRGLGTVNDNPGVDSAVAYSQDGLYVSHPQSLTPVLFDLKRVEAVLGPQGTLYGRNTNGGVINFITNDPAPTLGGYAKLGVGNFGAVTSELMLNLPLSDKWSLRLAGGSEKHNPHDQDGSNDAEAYAGRVKLMYTPNDDVRVLLAVDVAKRNSQGASYCAVCPPNTGVAACNGVTYVPWSGLLPESRSAFNDNSQMGASLIVDYRTALGNLTSLTGYPVFGNFGLINVMLDPPRTYGLGVSKSF
jgi:iron complex outermembrane recepter protein